MLIFPSLPIHYNMNKNPLQKIKKRERKANLITIPLVPGGTEDIIKDIRKAET